MILKIAVFLAALATANSNVDPDVKELTHAPVNITTPTSFTIFYGVEKPLKVNAKSPKTVRVGGRKLKAAPGGAPFTTVIVPADFQDGFLRIAADYYVCEDRPEAICWPRKVVFVIPVTEKGKKVTTLELHTPEFPLPVEN